MNWEGWGRWFVCNLLSQGPIPRHVAFIMDGNRRFAVQHGFARHEGHALGFERMQKVLEWCLDLGIETMTVYAFSIENFKRPQIEVDTLMNLVRTRFRHLLQDDALVQRHGVRVRIMGEMNMLPADVQEILAKAAWESRNNNRAVLNIAVAYTARDEMLRAMNIMCQGVDDGIITPDDITEDLFRACLFTSDPPDLVVRTSGERRLSDFMLWQSAYSCLSFLRVYWPDFSLWDLCQRNYDALLERRSSSRLPSPLTPKGLEFVQRLREKEQANERTQAESYEARVRQSSKEADGAR